MRLIDKIKFKEELQRLDCVDKFGYVILPITKLNIALERSAVDAVPVVRCRECKWFAEGKWCRNPNNDMVQGGTTSEWFCGDGKRKDGAE